MEIMRDLLPILQKTVKTQYIMKVLNKITSIESDGDIIAIFLGLHSVLHTAASKHKVTILNSLEHMILICPNEQSLSTKLDLLESSTPIIVTFGAIGENEINIFSEYFLVSYRDVKYKFTDLLSAFQFLLKFFKLFRLSFPQENSNVFDFLFMMFLNEKPNPNPSTKVIGLVNVLKEKEE